MISKKDTQWITERGVTHTIQKGLGRSLDSPIATTFGSRWCCRILLLRKRKVDRVKVHLYLLKTAATMKK